MQSSDHFDAVQRQERWRRWAKTLVKGVSVIALIVSLLALCTLISKTATRALPDGYALTDVGTAIQIHSDLRALLLAARNTTDTQTRQLDELTVLLRAVVDAQNKMIHLLSKLKAH
jgi:hypothetical protein